MAQCDEAMSSGAIRGLSAGNGCLRWNVWTFTQKRFSENHFQGLAICSQAFLTHNLAPSTLCCHCLQLCSASSRWLYPRWTQWRTWVHGFQHDGGASRCFKPSIRSQKSTCQENWPTGFVRFGLLAHLLWRHSFRSAITSQIWNKLLLVHWFHNRYQAWEHTTELG